MPPTTTFFFFFIRLSETIMLYLYDSRNNRYFEEKVNKQYEDRNDIPTKKLNNAAQVLGRIFHFYYK